MYRLGSELDLSCRPYLIDSINKELWSCKCLINLKVSSVQNLSSYNCLYLRIIFLKFLMYPYYIFWKRSHIYWYILLWISMGILPQYEITWQASVCKCLISSSPSPSGLYLGFHSYNKSVSSLENISSSILRWIRLLI